MTEPGDCREHRRVKGEDSEVRGKTNRVKRKIQVGRFQKDTDRMGASGLLKSTSTVLLGSRKALSPRPPDGERTDMDGDGDGIGQAPHPKSWRHCIEYQPQAGS
jgi:hypothetical protein